LREVSSQQQLAEDQRREEQGQSNRPKKKRKIQADSHPPCFDWNEAMKNLDPGQHAFSADSTLMLTGSLALWPPSFRGDLDMLNTLVRLSQSTKKENRKQSLFPLVKQSLTVVGGILQSVVTQPSAPSSHSLLKELASLVPLIINNSLPLIFPPALLNPPVAAFVQALHEQILHTSVMHFNLLSDSAASTLIKRRAKDSLGPERFSPSTDLRPVLLGLCQSTLNALKPYPQIQSSVSVVLSYSVVIQLRKGLDQLKPTDNTSEKKSSNANDRVRRLAFKDTFWYLASVLNASFCSVPVSIQGNLLASPLEEVARTTVLASLAEMLENKDGNGIIGLVERNMLIGVVEQAWKNGWAPFGEQGHEAATSSRGEEMLSEIDD
jgi:hypothetical protein